MHVSAKTERKTFDTLAKRLMHLYVADNKGDRLNIILDYLRKHLGTNLRANGGSYGVHALKLALTLSEVTKDTALFDLALLHDIFLEKDSKDIIKKLRINTETLSLLETIHNIRTLDAAYNSEELQKIMDTYISNNKVLLVRAAHRLNDVRELVSFPSEYQKKIATETLHIYAYLVSKLGLFRWRNEMEDICFKYLFPIEAQQIQELYKENRIHDELILDTIKKTISKALNKQNIKHELYTRTKKLYSCYRKMILKNCSFYDIRDRLAMRIIVPTRLDCYIAMGIIHAIMPPLRGKIKDYIASPKENGYQSLHSYVYPLPQASEQMVEIQIRTTDMNDIAENGNAKHYNYKTLQYDSVLRADLIKSLEIVKWRQLDSKRYKEALSSYLLGANIIVFDENNTLQELPKLARVIDYVAYYRPEKLPYLKFAKINGRRRDVFAFIQHGDIIELCFGRKLSINKTWLQGCETSTSKKIVTNALKTVSSV